MTQQCQWAASVQKRLLILSHRQNEDYNVLLVRYAMERFLYRLGASSHVTAFTVKGAVLLSAWGNTRHGATGDIDLSATTPLDTHRLAEIMDEVCQVSCETDGLDFLTDTLTVVPIEANGKYPGLRVRMQVGLGNGRIPLQVDLAHGDALLRPPSVLQFPALLDVPPPVVQAYPIETVVAEKCQILVSLGMTNDRLKDFFDLAFLARQGSFDSDSLIRSIRATFQRRQTALPTDEPVALTAAFFNDPAKQAQWRAFLKRGRLAPEELAAVVGALRGFLLPPLAHASNGEHWNANWRPGGPWH